MGKKDPRVDAYIAKAADFAKPVLTRIRQLVQAACPEVTETIKWSAPFYEHKGILICAPAFKKHCALIFWKGKLIFEKEAKDLRKKLRNMTSIADLPSDKILRDYIQKAVALNEAGMKTPRRQPKAKTKLVVPDYFLAAFKKNKKALATFENFSPNFRREYVEWIMEAKREETRASRIKTALEWMAAGKSRHWKYQQK
jgi:uncharacterized protein YdeI (YjbR/CyaY-like superfamily)